MSTKAVIQQKSDSLICHEPEVKHLNTSYSLETLEPLASGKSAGKRKPGSLLDKALGCTETVCDVQSMRDGTSRQAGRQSLFSPQLPEVLDNEQKKKKEEKRKGKNAI